MIGLLSKGMSSRLKAMGFRLGERTSPTGQAHLPKTNLTSAGRPPELEEIRSAADLRRKVVRDKADPKFSSTRCYPTTPTAREGEGKPVMVGHGPKQRLFVDGAGLCSPGLWPPEWRLVKHGAPQALRNMIWQEPTALGNARSGGLKGLLADLASGRILNDPFPASSTDWIRGQLSELLSKELEQWTPTGEVQDQPFKVRLLGTFLSDAGDADWEFLKMVVCGVQIGVGVVLPRTPAAYPEKISWRLREQRDLDQTSSVGDVEGK